LIAESDSGRVFEVTLSGEIVWEWYAGFMIKGNGKGKRRSINRMTRIPEDFFKNVEFNGRH
jgi:intein/homing endonuclease